MLPAKRDPMPRNLVVVESSAALASQASPVESRGDHVTPAQSKSRNRLPSVLLRKRVDTLFRHYPAALTGDEEAIHQLRVAGRRLRVALRLLVDKPEGKRACRTQRLLRELARIAGSSRDLDVLLENYSDRLKGLPERSPEQNRLRHRLGDARRRSRGRMVGALLDLEISRLRGDLAILIARAESPTVVIIDRFRALCDHEGKCLVDGFFDLGAVLDAPALHALRRRARRLRYAVEIFGEVATVEPGATKPWKNLQDRIGSLHDHHVLAEWFDAQATLDDKKGQPVLALAARAEARWAREAMHRLHDELLAAAPGEMVRQGLALVGPLPWAGQS